MSVINTHVISDKLRKRAIDLSTKKVLITNYKGSVQEKDLTEPANCDGFGRVRHFRLGGGEDWPINPLPIVPALKYLNLSQKNELRAQVFQNAVCNWRCWYCYVDFKLLNGDQNYGDFLSCDQLLDLYLNEGERPLMIDLSGGQPDLTPEWVPWMMESLTSRGLQNQVFLWSDDNLSNDYFWRFLSDSQIETIRSYKMYARVCCFKGVDETSFSINTSADGTLFADQFEHFSRLWNLGIDLYSYITLTAPSTTDFATTIPRFLDTIQKIDDRIPLKIVPLKIYEFSPMQGRTNVDIKDLMLGQEKAIRVWMSEIEKRFTAEARSIPIYEIRKI